MTFKGRIIQTAGQFKIPFLFFIGPRSVSSIIDVITKYNDSSCALAGQTGGAIRLFSIFLLFLFFVS